MSEDGGEVFLDNFAPFDNREVKELAEWVDWLPNHHETILANRPDVLILAARYGDGHLRAAKAIAMRMMLRSPKIKLGILDYYRFVNPRLDNTIRWAYLSSVRFAPSLWRWFYMSTQKINPDSSTQKFLNHIGLERFYEAMAPSPPKVIISTYPTAAGVVAALKRKGKLDVVNFVVMTDYSVHSQWIHRGVDMYFVGGEDMREELLARDIPSDRILVSGIPIDERFQEPVDEQAIRDALGIGTGPVILFMGGSYMPLNEYANVLGAIDRVELPHVTVVVAGREERRRQIAEDYQRQSKHPMVVLGYVDNVHELMGISSVLISKAGGLTTTEALCRGVPMIIHRPIPGQEDANADYLVRHGVGLRAKTEDDVGDILGHLLSHPWELKAMAKQARLLGHPNAADTITDQVRQALFRRQAHAPA